MRNIHLCGKPQIILLIALWIYSSVGYGQTVVYESEKKLNEGINTEAEEIMPLLAEGGNVLYFVRSFSEDNVGGKEAGQDIWVSEKKDGSWQAATNLKILNNQENNSVVGIDQNHNSLYLINNYTAPIRRKEKGIVAVTKNKKGWGNFDELAVSITVENDFYGFYLSSDETVLIISMMGDESLGEEDLYVSLLSEAGWSKPQHLGSVINSKGFEISPFLSADKSTLYFSSNGQGGLGNADIFASTRLDESWDNWSEPENLGSPINSPAFDAYFYLSNDNEVYFASNRDGKYSDLYQAVRTIKQEDVVALNDPMPEEDTDDRLPEDEKAEEKPSPEVPISIDVPAREVVLFDFNRFDFTQKSIAILSEVAEKLQQSESLSLTAVGHADTMGPEDYNYQLSVQRAKAVSEYLSDRYNINPDRIKVIGKGETEPVNLNVTAEQRGKNRRVELSFDVE